MVTMKAKIIIAALIALSLVSSTFAQQAQTPPPQPAAQAPRSPDYVDFSGFKGKVFDVKHREPYSLMMALRPLGSGFKGATIQHSDEFKTLTVRDFPENIAAMEEALKRLDMPQPPRPDMELRMHVLIASNAEGITSQFPNDLNDVVKQLQTTLNYKSYTNLATVVQRVSDGAREVNLKGSAEVAGSLIGTNQPVRSFNAVYEYYIPGVNMNTEPSGGYTVQLKDTRFQWSAIPTIGNATIRTSLNVRSGEKVVVGTATLGNKGLILVLSARVLK